MSSCPKLPVLALLAFVFAFVRTAFAQGSPGWSPGFESTGLVGGGKAVAVFDDGRGPALYLGGSFSTAGTTPAANVVRWDGERWEPLASGVNGAVNSLAVFDDGTGAALYAGGTFTTAGGVAAPSVARWNGTSWSAVGAAFTGTVERLRVLDLGAGPVLLAGGGFTHVGGAPLAGLARWNGASWSGFGNSPSFLVFDMARFDDGSGAALYVGGAFNSTGSTSALNIARWNGTSWSAVAGGVNGAVYALHVSNVGGVPALYATGSFTLAGGVAASRVARYAAGAWSALGTGLTVTTNPTGKALATFDDGSGAALYVGGALLGAGGVASSSIVRWNGSAWSSVAGGTTGLSTVVEDLAAYDAGDGPELGVTGSFDAMVGVSARGCARWNGVAWRALDDGQGMTGSIAAITVHDDGGGPALFAAGEFATAGRADAQDVARWSGTQWTPLGSGLSGVPAALTSFDDGTGPALYVAGNLSTVVPPTIFRIARWNGTSWSAVGAGLADIPYALAVFDDGSGNALYAGGYALNPGGFVKRWNGATWSSVGAPNGTVFAFAVHDDGTGPALYAGGVFTSISGVPVGDVARWNGTSWSAVGSGIPSDFRVQRLASWNDGTGPKLVACGRFTTIDGVAAARIAQWDGATWSPLGAGANTSVDALAVHDDGTGAALYAAGTFTSMGGAPADRIARWNGSAWSALGTGLELDAHALAVFDDGRVDAPALYVGGSFATAGGSGSAGIARWSGRGSPGVPFCAGDGRDASVTTACPCSNVGVNGRGCANSADVRGARLGALGAVNPDTVQLLADGMPGTVTAIFLKGSASLDHGVVFGDGVRCVDGALLRLSTVHNVGGASQYPTGAQPPLSVRGQTPPGSGLVARYQVYYRNAAASFCPPETFNVSNGYRIAW